MVSVNRGGWRRGNPVAMTRLVPAWLLFGEHIIALTLLWEWSKTLNAEHMWIFVRLVRKAQIRLAFSQCPCSPTKSLMSWEEFALGPTKLLRVCAFRCRCHASIRFPPRVDFILGIPPFSVKHDGFVFVRVFFFLILYSGIQKGDGSKPKSAERAARVRESGAGKPL